MPKIEVQDERDALWQCLAAFGVPEEAVAAKLHAKDFARTRIAHPVGETVPPADVVALPEVLGPIGRLAGLGAFCGAVTRLPRT